MSIRVHWHDEARRIWYQEFEGQWTLEEYSEAVTATHRAIDSVAPHPAYVISKIIPPLHLPHGIIHKLHQVSLQIRPNERLHIIVGGGVIVRSLNSVPIVRRLNPHIRLADTLQEALALVEQDIQQAQAL